MDDFRKYHVHWTVAVMDLKWDTITKQAIVENTNVPQKKIIARRDENVYTYSFNSQLVVV